jgi:hypothetical protein
MTNNFSVIFQFRDFGSGQIRNSGTNFHTPGLPDARFASVRAGAKIAPWCLARRDYFLAKVPGLVSAGCVTNAFCSYPLADTGDNLHIARQFCNLTRWPEMLTDKAKFQSLPGLKDSFKSD